MKSWIPPVPLLFAQFAHGVSWALVFAAAWTGNLQTPAFQFAWIHTVALGWITLAALSILTFALAEFTDSVWPRQALSRWCVLAFAAGVGLLVYAFLRDASLLAAAAAILLIALLVYLTSAFETIARAMRGERVQRAVARAFAGTLLFLLAAVVIGFFMAWSLSGRLTPSLLTLAPAHAHLGTLGWISLLIFGISMRTFRPITGSGGTRFRWMHIVVGSCGALGALLLAFGLSYAGGALFAAAVLGYAFDTFDMLRRAANPHRPPQAFIAASVVWLLVSMVLGGGVLRGEPWQAEYIFTLLIGWAGQMVNAHLYHIGIRVLATVYRGEDDETEPREILDPRLSWYSFAMLQLGVAVVLVALLEERSGLAARGAIFGLIGWIAMVANVLVARVRATASRTIRL